jgi:hypothetical protein
VAIIPAEEAWLVLNAAIPDQPIERLPSGTSKLQALPELAESREKRQFILQDGITGTKAFISLP